jgi:hypothetical protein
MRFLAIAEPITAFPYHCQTSLINAFAVLLDASPLLFFA